LSRKEKKMDRNELLVVTREKYLYGFLDSINQSLSQSAVGLFKKADNSYSSLGQVRFLDARGILLARDADLRMQMHKSMDQLLNRSLQTTYSTFRPSFASDFDVNSLALVESNVLEDELRIVEITNRFRNEAEEQVRDLNIRIALLFEQGTIKERENPFRPYLLSRSIATSIENAGISGEIAHVIFVELAEHMEPHVARIYDAVNSILAQHGIAKQLQKIIKSRPKDEKNLVATSNATDEPAPVIDERPEVSSDFTTGGRSEFGGVAASRDSGTFEASSMVPGGTVDQLLDVVRGTASHSIAGGNFLNSASVRKQERRSGANGVHGQAHTGSQNDGQRGGSAEAAYSGQEHDHAGQSSGWQPVADGSAPRGGWLAGTRKVGDVLRRVFSTQTGSTGGDAGPATDNPIRKVSVQLAESVDQMIRERTPSGEGMLVGDGEVRNLLFEERIGLNSKSSEVDEQMTIDIVAMLFEFILRDTQIPAEVRAQLGRLQFLVLKIALLDTSLLTKKGHPARLLVNRIGSISLGLKQVDPSGVRVTAEICRIVEELLSDESGNVDLFKRMLDEFDAFIAQELRAGDEKVEQAVQVLENAQNRTLRFAHSSAKMAEALSNLTIDPFLHDFLVNGWMQAIERAERTDAELARKFRLLVPDLLWSIVPKTQKEDQSLLFALLPIALMTLRQGLSLTDYTAEQKQKVLNWLMNAHTSALRSGVDPLPAPGLSSIHDYFKTFIDNPEAEPVSDVTGKSPAKYKQFFDDALKENDLKIQLLDKVFEHDAELPNEESVEASAPASKPESDAEAKENVLERLRSGVAIKINLGGNPSLGRLNWIDSNVGNMILTLDQQNTPSMISVRVFRRLYNTGRVSFLEAVPLFERAVESLLKSGEQLDSKDLEAAL
jgi:hypothetical protein